jgi:hypothetical protein
MATGNSARAAGKAISDGVEPVLWKLANIGNADVFSGIGSKDPMTRSFDVHKCNMPMIIAPLPGAAVFS